MSLSELIMSNVDAPQLAEVPESSEKQRQSGGHMIIGGRELGPWDDQNPTNDASPHGTQDGEESFHFAGSNSFDDLFAPQQGRGTPRSSQQESQETSGRGRGTEPLPSAHTVTTSVATPGAGTGSENEQKKVKKGMSFGRWLLVGVFAVVDVIWAWNLFSDDGKKPLSIGQSGLNVGEEIKNFANGSKYIGEWKDGLFHGQGTYFDAPTNGESRPASYKGQWVNGKPDGKVSHTYTVATPQQGERTKVDEMLWENGCCTRINGEKAKERILWSELQLRVRTVRS